MSSESPRSVTPRQPFSNSPGRQVIPDDHPSLRGHFPGNPIVPGVVILEEVMRVFEDWWPGDRVVGMPVVKFLAPLRPGQPFTIRFAESGARDIRFECVRDDSLTFARGYLTVARDRS